MKLSSSFSLLLVALTSSRALPSTSSDLQEGQAQPFDSSLYLDLQAREENPSGDPGFGKHFPKVDPSLPLDQLPNTRPQTKNRRFTSKIVDEEIDRVAEKITDPALKRLWQK